MKYPLTFINRTIGDANGEAIAYVENGPFGNGAENAKELVELANLGYRTKQHQEELENLSALKGEACYAFAPSVMVEFTAEEFANFQTGLWALRQLSRRTETPQQKKAEPASTDIAEGHNPDHLTNEQVGKGFRLLVVGEKQMEADQWNYCAGEWRTNEKKHEGSPVLESYVAHRRRTS